MEDGIMQTFLALIAIVLVLSLVLMFVKKYAAKAKKAKNGIGLDVISRTSLSPKSHLYIVKAQSKTLLIGVTDNNIQTLSELDNNTAPQQKKTTRKTTSSHLSALAKKYGVTDTGTKSKSNKKIKENNPSDDLSFSSFLRSTLNQTGKKN